MVCAPKSNGKKAMKRLKRLRRFANKLKDRKQRWNIKRSVKTWDEHLAELRPGEFKKRYRMSQDEFNFLLATIAKESKFFKRLTSQQEKQQS